jgi:hypothetical protein
MNRLERALVAVILWFGSCVGQLKGQVLSSDTGATLLGQLALHEWALLYREFHTEFLECLYGRASRDTVTVFYGVLADVKPSHSRATMVAPQADGMCAITGDSLVGIAHNHPQSCRGGNGAACGLQVTDSESMHPQDDPGNDPCYESFPDIRTFIGSGLELNIVVCGVGKLYVQRRGARPNKPADICLYDAEQDIPRLACGKR